MMNRSQTLSNLAINELNPRPYCLDFEPFRPINTSLYLCDNKFHTEALSELLQAAGPRCHVALSHQLNPRKLEAAVAVV